MRQSRWRKGWMIAGVVLGFAAVLMVTFGIAVTKIADDLSHLGAGASRKHLKAIPVAVSACPYVYLMHAAANNFQRVQPPFPPFAAFDEHGKLVSWPQLRARTDVTLKSLEASIQSSESKFPAPIRQQLGLTLTAVREGRHQLALAHDEGDLWDRTQGVLGDGKQAFGYASDLIGTQCGVMLGAVASPYPFGATTTTRG